MRASVRLYRSLLLGYPRHLREAFGEDMVVEFRTSLVEAMRERPVFGGLATWAHTLGDWAGTLTRERRGAGGSTWARDLRHGLRGVSRSPGYATIFVLTLGLGIGANTAIFSVVNGVLLRPLPHDDGRELVHVRQSAPFAGVENVLFSVPEIEDVRAGVGAFAAVAEYSVLTFTVLGLEEPRRITGGVVTGNYFEVLGLRPVLGRVLTPADDGEHAAPVAVLTYEHWRRNHGGDPAAVGRSLEMNGRSISVVGVLEPAPPYPERTDVYVNMAASPHHLGATMNHDRRHRMTEVFARLAPDETLERAQAQAAEASAAMYADHPGVYDPAAGYRVTVLTLRERLTQRATPTLMLLLATAAFVLVIACANVANLTLTRVIRRDRELAVRASLGASRATLRRELLAESLLLALLGVGLGVVVARIGLDALVLFTSRLTARATEVTLDAPVFLFALAIATAAALLFAWVPRLPDRIGSLSSRGATQGVARRRLQGTLVVTQITVSFVLLVGAGLLTRTLWALGRVDPGLETERLLAMEVPAIGIRTPEEFRTYYRTMVERVETVPGVRSAAIGTVIPLGGEPSSFTSALEMRVDGHVSEPGEPAPRADFRPVSHAYFETLGLRLVAGRFLDASDAGSESVVVINEALADRYFRDREPVGGRVAWHGELMEAFGMSTEWRTVVGVVANVRDYGLDRPVLSTIYQPFTQGVAEVLYVRTLSDPSMLGDPISKEIRALNPRQPIEDLRTMEEIHADSVATRRVNAFLIGAFAVLAMAIAAVGVFAVLAFSVNRRTRELGVRSALGADAGTLLRAVFREGGALVVLGLALGGGIAAGLSRFLEGALFGVGPTDALTWAGVTGLLLSVAAAAVWLPARRASGIDPARALRSE